MIVEDTARMLVRYRIFENTYLAGPQSETQLTMKEALVRLYAEMLTFLGTALNFYRERSIGWFIETNLVAVNY